MRYQAFLNSKIFDFRPTLLGNSVGYEHLKCLKLLCRGYILQGRSKLHVVNSKIRIFKYFSFLLINFNQTIMYFQLKKTKFKILTRNWNFFLTDRIFLFWYAPYKGFFKVYVASFPEPFSLLCDSSTKATPLMKKKVEKRVECAATCR